MSGLTIFTLIHVVISLVAIGSGFVVLFGLIAGKRLDGWTAFFLATTVATSVTGFGFPIHGFTPGIGIGIISLLVLAVAIFARYARRLTGIWRRGYVVTAVIALYLNFFVLIVQSFQKVPVLKMLAPTQSERVRSRQCQGFPRNPGRFHPGSGLSPSLDQLGAIEREASFLVK
jgi:hypothetical protein